MTIDRIASGSPAEKKAATKKKYVAPAVEVILLRPESSSLLYTSGEDETNEWSPDNYENQ